MEFKSTTIPPKGRNKYGTYLASANIARKIATYTNSSNIYSGTGGGNTPTPPKTNDNYGVTLSKLQGNYEWDDIVANGEYIDTLQVLTTKNFNKIPSFIGVFETDEVSDIWDIRGIPEKGLSIEVKNNGTNTTTIDLKFDTNVDFKKATLYIPISIYTGSVSSPEGDEKEDWILEKDNIETIWVEYNISVLMNAVNSYTLDLSNEIAGINWNNDGTDTMMENANLPTCKATLYFGGSICEEATYGANWDADKEVQGLSINTSTGELTFGANFHFKGTMLEIRVFGTDKGTSITKIMTINKIYPGKDGNAVSRWIIPQFSQILFDPNNNTIYPSSISAKVMKQINSEMPIVDTETTLYWGYNGNATSVYNGPISSINISKNDITFALKNEQGQIYEQETIPIVKNGVNGKIGDSSYVMLLTNQYASVNCDSNGNILTNSTLPTCSIEMYYGKEDVTDNFTYTLDTTAIGVSVNNSDLVFGSNFSFTGNSVEIIVKAELDGNTYGEQIMTIAKNIPGKNGNDAVRYYMVFSSHSFMINSAGSPTLKTITITPYKQIGSQDPVIATSETKIVYGKNTTTPSLTYSTGITYSTDASFYSVRLYDSNQIKLYDSQTIPVLKDGKNGSNGSDGRQGASIRGPIDYNNVTKTRRFCSGTLTDSNYPQDALYIDIISVLLPGESQRRIYRCIASHNWDPRDIDEFNGGIMDNFWEESYQYNFIASDVILANNGKINFSSTNELTLLDKNGNVTGGAAGTNNPKDINFWAGASDPANAPFKVNNQGYMTATKGEFGNLIIAADNWGDSELYGSFAEDEIENIISIQPHHFRMYAYDENTSKKLSDVVIAPYFNRDKYDYEAMVSVEAYNSGTTTIYTDGIIKCEGVKKVDLNTDNELLGIWSPFVTSIVPMTDSSSLFTKVNSTWCFNGSVIRPHRPISTSLYPNIRINSQTGYWEVYNSSGGSFKLGIASTAVAREGNKLYIQI